MTTMQTYLANASISNGKDNSVKFTTGGGNRETFKFSDTDKNNNTIAYNYRAPNDTFLSRQVDIPEFKFNGGIINYATKSATGFSLGTNSRSYTNARTEELSIGIPGRTPTNQFTGEFGTQEFSR